MRELEGERKETTLDQEALGEVGYRNTSQHLCEQPGAKLGRLRICDRVKRE